MKTVKTSELQPGMMFSAPVYMEGDSLFVDVGHET